MISTSASSGETSKTVFITGGTSGIGYQAVITFLNNGYKLVLACRNQQTTINIINKLVADNSLLHKLNLSKQLFPVIMDLSDLISIKKSTRLIQDQFDNIDILILNAGLQYTGSKSPRYSLQNIELTLAVNHIANVAIVKELSDILMNSSNPRVLITSSAVHDPNTPGGKVGASATLGDLSGLNQKPLNMIDGSKLFNADKAYKDTKLCNILFGYQLYKYLAERYRKIPVITWAPGLVIPRTKTGFFRYSRQYNNIGQIAFAFLARDLLQITESVERAGNILFQLSTNELYSEPEISFYSNRIVFPNKKRLDKILPSREAQDTQLAQKLWDTSNNIISEFI